METNEREHGASPEADFLKLLGGRWVTAAMGAAASLGVAEALDVPRDLATLSRLLRVDEAALRRLLRVLCAHGLLATSAPSLRSQDARGDGCSASESALSTSLTEEGQSVAAQGATKRGMATQARHEKADTALYRLTAVGACLRREAMGDLASFVTQPFAWDPWSSLHKAVRDGRSAFLLHHGATLFDHLDAHPSDAACYHAAIDAFTRHEAEALSQLDLFQGNETVIDIGGGRGSLLVAMLRRWPGMRAALFDRSAALDQAQRHLSDSGVSGRCETHLGSFFDASSFAPLHAQFDVAVLKHVIHNWDDEDARVILRHSAATLKAGGKLLLIEGLLLPEGRSDTTGHLDLEMLALCGSGRERSKPAMRRLCASAGLKIVATQPLSPMSRLMTCTRLSSDAT